MVAVSIVSFSACKKKVPGDDEIVTQILGTWEGSYSTGEGFA